MPSSDGDDEDKESVVNSKSVESPLPSPSFLEVTCKNTGKVWRFAAGTEAVFALRVINYKLAAGYPPAVYIESVKEGEEPVIFGPNAVLVNYGKDWELQTVLGEGRGQRRSSQVTQSKHSDIPEGSSDLQPTAADVKNKGARDTVGYLGKILLVFIFMFILGGVFTYILENLPEYMSYF